MAYRNVHLVLRAGGHFGTSSVFADNWSIGLRFGFAATDVALDPVALSAFNESAWGLFASLHPKTTVGAGTACYLDWVTSARVGTDGKYNPAQVPTTRHDGAPIAGGSSSTQPWNTALVVSLRTIAARGYASNGRMYYPCTAFTAVATTGRVADSNVLSRLNEFKTLIDGLNSAANVYQTGMRLCVMSAVGSGLTYPVTSLRGDGRFDSQERRENKTPSTWSSVTLA